VKGRLRLNFSRQKVFKFLSKHFTTGHFFE